MSNAYSNASLLVTPNGYEAGTIFSAKPTDGSGDLSFSRASTALRRNSSGLWESVANNVPRLNYPVGGGCPSWLFEPQATNIILTSNDSFQNGTNGSSATSTEATNIVGVNFRKMTATAIDGFIFNNAANVSTTPTGVMIFAVLLKKGSCDVVQLIDQSSTGRQITVNLTSGTVVSSNFTLGSGIISDGNGQYWVYAIQDYTSIGFRFDLYAKQIGDFYYSTTQMISGSVLQSPIITAGSAVTRVADNPSKNLTGLIGSAASTFYLELDSAEAEQSNGNLNIFFSAASDGLSGNGFWIRNDSASPVYPKIFKRVSGTSTQIYGLTTRVSKIAITINGATANLYVNGVKVVNATPFTSLNLIYFAISPNIIQSLSEMIIYPISISDAEAIALTTL